MKLDMSHTDYRFLGLIIYFLDLLDAVRVILVLMGAWYERVVIYEGTESVMMLSMLFRQFS